MYKYIYTCVRFIHISKLERSSKEKMQVDDERNLIG